MRYGQLLTETTPKKLLERFQSESLEEAFLTLSQMHQENRDKGIVNEALIEDDDENELLVTLPQSKRKFSAPNEHTRRFFNTINPKILRALLIKNYIQYIRNPG